MIHDTHDDGSGLVSAFIDGELDSAGEMQLFAALASDSDLRSELKEGIFVRSMVAHDVSHLHPPPALKASVERRIFPRATVALQKEPSLLVFTWSRGMWAAAAIVLTLLSISVIGQREMTIPGTPAIPGLMSSITDLAARTARGWAATVGRDAQPPPARSIAATARSSAPVRQASFIRTERARVPTEYVAPSTRSTLVSPTYPELFVAQLRAGPNVIVLPESRTTTTAKPHGPVIVGAMEPTLYPEPEGVPGLGFGLHGIAGSSFPAVSLPSESGGLENIAASVRYRLNDRTEIGLEVGREMFNQEYDGTEPTALTGNFTQQPRHVTYRQAPALTSVGVRYRVMFDDLFKGVPLAPYVGAYAGGTSVGALGRMEIGLRLFNDDRTTLTAGMEGSLLAYSYQQTWFTSRRVSFTYGVSTRLW